MAWLKGKKREVKNERTAKTAASAAKAAAGTDSGPNSGPVASADGAGASNGTGGSVDAGGAGVVATGTAGGDATAAANAVVDEKKKKPVEQAGEAKQPAQTSAVSSAASAEPTAEEKLAAEKIVREKLGPVADAIKATGLSDSDGNDVKKDDVLKWGPAPGTKGKDKPETAAEIVDGTTTCWKCKKKCFNTKGLRKHFNAAHGGKVVVDHAPAAAAPQPRESRTADPNDEANKKAAPAATPSSDGERAWVEFDAVWLFDNALLKAFPPPLEEHEIVLLQKTKMRIRVPQWLYNVGVFIYILGPRIAARIPEWKARFDEEVRREEESLKQQEAAKRAAERAQEAAERSEAAKPAAAQVATPQTPPASNLALLRAGDVKL